GLPVGGAPRLDGLLAASAAQKRLLGPALRLASLSLERPRGPRSRLARRGTSLPSSSGGAGRPRPRMKAPETSPSQGRPRQAAPLHARCRIGAGERVPWEYGTWLPGRRRGSLRKLVMGRGGRLDSGRTSSGDCPSSRRASPHRRSGIPGETELAESERILILHAKAGAGHKRAAEALEHAFRAVGPSNRVHALDTL